MMHASNFDNSNDIFFTTFFLSEAGNSPGDGHFRNNETGGAASGQLS